MPEVLNSFLVCFFVGPAVFKRAAAVFADVGFRLLGGFAHGWLILHIARENRTPALSTLIAAMKCRLSLVSPIARPIHHRQEASAIMRTVMAG